MLCMAVPKGISVEVDSSFWSIKTPSQTVQASSKAYGFLDVDDIYTDGSYMYGTMKYHMGGYLYESKSAESLMGWSSTS